MTKEARVFKDFLVDVEEVYFLGNRVVHQKLVDEFRHCILRICEAPDLFIKKDNVVFIIEHFAFDASKTNRKGSKNQRELARIQRVADEVFIKNNSCYHLDSIDGGYCYEDYVKNALDGLKAHYEKVTAYKEHLKNKDVITLETEIKVFFLVEDTTSLPLLYKGETAPLQQVTLAFSKEFLEGLVECSNLDGVILCQRGGGEGKCTWIILRESIPEFYKKALDYNDSTVISFKPNTISFNIPGPSIKT